MAAGAGVVGGAVLGAGAYYAYSHYTSGSPNVRDQSWCNAPYDSSDAGKTMSCGDCNQLYGSKCQSQNDCHGSSGCGYQLTQDTTRDEIMSTGFIPMEYIPPLTMKVNKITGDDFTASKVCPGPQPDVDLSSVAGLTDWKKASMFNINLFMTLTQMDNTDGLTIENPASSSQALVHHHLIFFIVAIAALRSLFGR